MAPVIRNPGVRQLKVRYRETIDEDQIIVPFVGPYETLKGMRPKPGELFSGFDTKFRVAESSLAEGQSLDGRLDVTLARRRPQSENPTDPSPVDAPVYEIDWIEERRPLEQHKKCGRLKANRKFYEFPEAVESAANPGFASPPSDKVVRQRTWDHWEALGDDDYEPAGSGWTLANYKSLRSDGWTDYPISYPVCSATTYHRSMPVTSPAWVPGNPPAQCQPPSGWDYIKSVDRALSQGKLYSRVQQWRGFEPKGGSTLIFP